MYSVETCGCCIHERTCAYDFPCDECSVLISRCKKSYFEEVDSDASDQISEHVDVDYPELEELDEIDSYYYINFEKKHFDGFYSRPKMNECFKMHPNVCNLNNKIKKARNLL